MADFVNVVSSSAHPFCTRLVYDDIFRVTFAITVWLLDSVIERRGHCDVLCSATTEMMKPTERTRTTTGSTLSPGDSSV